MRVLSDSERVLPRGSPPSHFARTDTSCAPSCPPKNTVGVEFVLRYNVRSAGMVKEDVTYINAHGTSTNYNDKVNSAGKQEKFAVTDRYYCDNTSWGAVDVDVGVCPAYSRRKKDDLFFPQYSKRNVGNTVITRPIPKAAISCV